MQDYVESNWSTFLRAVEKEGKRGEDLAANRYLFVTSRPLTPLQQGKLSPDFRRVSASS